MQHKFAFVEFANPESRDIALHLTGVVLAGEKPIKINPSHTPILGTGQAKDGSNSTNSNTLLSGITHQNGTKVMFNGLASVIAPDPILQQQQQHQPSKTKAKK